MSFGLIYIDLVASYCVVQGSKKVCVRACALRGKGQFFYNLIIFFELYSARNFSTQVFSALLPHGNYKIKFNEPSDASGRGDTAI